MKSFGVTIQMKPLISAVLSHCTTVFNVVLTFESMDKIQLCDHSNETSSAVLSGSTIYLVCSSNFCVFCVFCVCALQQYFHMVLCIFNY